VLKNILDKFFKKNSLDILEVGCGPGGYFNLLKNHGRLTALEPNKNDFKSLSQYKDVKIIFCFEGILLKFLRFPVGLSVVVLARKPV